LARIAWYSAAVIGISSVQLARTHSQMNWRLSHRTWRPKLKPEDVFRETNERIAERAREFGFRLRVPFICECSDQGCFGFIRLSLEEYEEARSDPHRYLTISGHEVLGALVITRDARFALAEKL